MISRYFLLSIAVLLLVVSVSATVVDIYPSIDAQLQYLNGDGTTWATLHDAATATSVNTTYEYNNHMLMSTPDTGTYYSLTRSVLLLNTTAIPTGATINSAKLSMVTSYSSFAWEDWHFVVTGGRLTSNSSIVAGDYSKFDNVEYTAREHFSALDNIGRVNFTITNLSGIQKGGYTVFYIRSAEDVLDTTPTWSSDTSAEVVFLSNNDAIPANRPYLEVDYTGGTPSAPVAAFSANATSGTTPLSVGFTDSSTNTPTAWKWYWYANETVSSTSQHPTTSLTSGTYNVRLNASNSYGYDWENKTSYIIVNSPGTGTITTYPMLFINETRILPTSNNLPPTGTTLSINTTPDQYEASSFVLKPDIAVTDLTITATDLTDGLGHTIYKNATTIKTVKVWYQADADDIDYETLAYVQTPELLLNNDSIVRVNYTDHTNELWIKNTTFEGYIHIDHTNLVFPTNARVYDNATAGGFPQPFAVPVNTNKQIWLTTHVPDGQTAGTYTGTIYLNSSATTSKSLTFVVKVLPFDLDSSSLDYGIYTYSSVSSTATSYDLQDSYSPRPSAIYAAELQNMKIHGVEYPDMSQWWGGSSGEEYTNYELALSLRSQSGLPKDKIFMSNSELSDSDHGLSQNSEILAEIADTATGVKNRAAYYGFPITYMYGIDEVAVSDMPDEVLSITTARNAGVKVYIGTDYSDEAFSEFGSLISGAVLGNAPDAEHAADWQGIGAKVYSYNNPQLGVENPEIYRQNYGLGLWKSGYNGSMDFSYNLNFGANVWNDYDNGETSAYRDHVMAYPTTTGVIDTIQWEGWREGVDDTRFADTLTRLSGSRTEPLSIINAGLTAGKDMSFIRGNLIDALLETSAETPVASFYVTNREVSMPTFTDFIDTSTNSPTNWDWYWSNDEIKDSDEQDIHNPVLSFGLHSIRLYVSNAAGGDWENKTDWVNVTSYSPPISHFTANVTSGTAPLAVQFNDTSHNVPTEWHWYWYSNEDLSSSTRNASTVFAAGTYNIRLNASNVYGSRWSNNTIPSDSDSIITVYAAAPPVSNFTKNVSSGSGSVAVKFIDISTNVPTAWNWTATNVTGTGIPFVFSRLQNPVYTFYAGNYSIVLNASNALGYNIAGAQFVNVSSASGIPVANFASDFTTVSVGQPVYFTDTSTPAATSWGWCFGEDLCPDYSNSHLENPVNTYLNPGTYTVALKATNALGSNISQKINYITVIPASTGVIADFNPRGTYHLGVWQMAITRPSTLVFTDASLNSPTSWYWTVGDAQGNHYFTSPSISFTWDETNSVNGMTYTIRLDASNAFSTSSATSRVVTHDAQIIPIIAFNVTNLNTGQEIHVTTGNPSTNYITAVTGDVIRFVDKSYNNPLSHYWILNAGNGSYYSYSTSTSYMTYTTAPSGWYGASLEDSNDAGSASLTALDIVHLTRITPPVGIMYPTNITYPFSIQWNWTNPAGSEFSHVMVWKNGVFFENTTEGSLWLGLSPNTTYNLATKVVSTAGYTSSFVNASATTTNPIWIWNTTGTSTWVCPPDINFISIFLVGGGGSGKGGSTNHGGGGGDAGEILTVNKLDVIPGQTYNIIVGNGGSSSLYGTPSNAGAATLISKTGTPILSAAGGSGGTLTYMVGGNGISGYDTIKLSDNGTWGTQCFAGFMPSCSGGTWFTIAGGTGGLGYGAGGGGGGFDTAHEGTTGNSTGGKGAGGYAKITVYGFQGGNLVDFSANPTTSQPGSLIQFTDLSVIVNSTGLTYNWSFGDPFSSSPYSSAIGNTAHVYSLYGTYDVSLNVTNIEGSVVETKTGYITISSEAGGKINTLYPREVSFTLVDRYGRALSDLPVTATMTSSSISNTDWLTSMFGLADNSINSTVLSDITDDNGQVVFPMIASGRYHLTFYDPSRGINEGRDVHPDQEDYIYILSTSDAAIAASSADAINITIRAYPLASTNPTTVYLIGNYTDSSSTTSRVTFYVMYANQTTVYTTSSTANTISAQYPVSNVAGMAYVWGINATTSKFGQQSKSVGITLPGTGANGLANNLVKSGCNNWKCT